MKVTTLPGIVENGQIRLVDDVRIPDKTPVYVVIPNVDFPEAAHLASPRLAHPEQASEFVKSVEVLPDDAV